MRILPVIFLAVFTLLGASVPAVASPPAENSSSGGEGSGVNRFVMLFNRADAEDEEEEEDIVEDDPRAFNMPALVAPLSSDGRLTGFAYVNVRIRVAAGRNVWTMQERAHYALDILVRAAYRTPLSLPDGSGLDFERAEEVWSAALAEYYGEEAIATLEIRSSDVRMLDYY